MKADDFFVSSRSARWIITLFLVLLGTNVGRTAGVDSRKSDHTKSLFKANCAVCHGEDGTGAFLGKRLQAPDLTSHEVQSQPNAALEHIIKEGKNGMPPFGDRLDSQEIRSLVAHVRHLAPNAGAAKK